MNPQQIEYYQARERAERAAAKAAACPQARRVHQELAQHYQDVVRLGGEAFARAERGTAKPNYIVLTRG